MYTTYSNLFVLECDPFHYGLNCESKCDCSIGSERCDPVDGCQCKNGWTGEKCQLDEDECNNSPCTQPNYVCTNLPGSLVVSVNKDIRTILRENVQVNVTNCVYIQMTRSKKGGISA